MRLRSEHDRQAAKVPETLAGLLGVSLDDVKVRMEDPHGANLWLVVPNDAGVFHGAAEKDGIHCVHPVQAYFDLKGHSERASEAAERLRNEFLDWRRGGRET